MKPETQKPPGPPLVFVANRDATCSECGENIFRGEFLKLEDEDRRLCLRCTDLAHLIYLPSGNTALARRSRKYSTLAAVVLKFSRARRRNERQGILVEEHALERAEEECASDEEARAAAREKASGRREMVDRDYVRAFSERVGEVGRSGSVANWASIFGSSVGVAWRRTSKAMGSPISSAFKQQGVGKYLADCRPLFGDARHAGDFTKFTIREINGDFHGKNLQ